MKNVTTSSKNKVVFAVTSKGKDIYSTMTRVAVASLRLSNPNLFIIVACDNETDKSLKHSNDPLIEEVDRWLKVDTPTGSEGYRNRFVKTNLRKLIDGPFLFLDSDVLVRKDLSEIFSLDADIAAARNHSRETFPEQIWEADEAAIKALGWEIGSNMYINGGVILFNDTPKARQFVEEWHKNWQYSYERLQRYRDQPSLNYTLKINDSKFSMLSDMYNAQFKYTPSVALDAKIWHYYSSTNNKPSTKYELLVKSINHGAELRTDLISEMITSPSPWRENNIVDYLAAKHLMRSNNPDGWGTAWLNRQMRHYICKRLRSISNLTVSNKA